MRSIFDETLAICKLTINGTLNVEGEKLHHLLNVVRVKVDEKILLLNGKGEKIYTSVESIEKKLLILRILKFELEKKSSNISAMVGITKKETFEDIVRLSIEAGLTTIYPLVTEYSKPEFIQNKRVHEIMKNSIEQSNNSWGVTIEDGVVLAKLSDRFFDQFDAVFIFINLTEKPKTTQCEFMPLTLQSKILIVIGAEGGFSETEKEQLSSFPKVQIISFPSPIMRTPTALAAAIGYVFAKVK